MPNGCGEYRKFFGTYFQLGRPCQVITWDNQYLLVAKRAAFAKHAPNIMQSRAFIFDFDGTIAETIPLTLDAFSATYLRLGLSVPKVEDFKAHFGADESGIFKTLNPDLCDEIYRTYLVEYERLLRERCMAPFPGIVDLFKLLQRRGLRMSVVTGKCADTARISVDFMGIGGYFDYVESGDPKGSVKPEKIRRILDAYGMEPSEAFYLGDSPQDVVDSRAVGVRPFVAAWSRLSDLSRFADLAPVEVFGSVEEIAEFAKSYLV